MKEDEQSGLIDEEELKSNDDNSEFQAKILEDNKRIRKESNSISNFNKEVLINDNEEEHEHKKIPIEQLNYFSNILTLFYIVTTFQSILPEIVIISSDSHINYNDLFNRLWWLLLIFCSIFISIVLSVYFLKRKIFRNLGSTIPIFVTYLFLLILIYTFVSFYSVVLTLSCCIIQFAVFSLILLFNQIQRLKSKPHVQLLFIYSLIGIGFILYCFLVKENIVGCFIYLIFLMVVCMYMIFEFKRMFIDFVNFYKVDYEKDVSLMLCAVAMMNSNIDIFTCVFRPE